MRLIDADALPYDEFLNGTRIVMQSDIDNAPTVDAVEVVRCKDCVNWSDDKSHHCPLVAWWNGANDYCSAGARKGVTDD